MNKISIDIGYSSSKIVFNDQYYKVPTAISFANDAGIEFGETAKYSFEGEEYYVGDAATDEAFTTTDYQFLHKFGPLIIYHIFKKLGIAGEISLNTGLALTDWGHRQEFQERLAVIEVDGVKVTTGCKVVGPQGSGIYNAYIAENNLYSSHPDSCAIIDIGYRTINFLYYERGEPQQSKMKGYPGSGVVSIMKTFSNYLETTYGVNFSEQEALKIFMSGKLSLSGEEQPAVPEKIKDLKGKFVQKLMNSILVKEKKTCQFAEVVIIGGGGSYLIQDVMNQKNVKYNQDPKEFANVRGYGLIG